MRRIVFHGNGFVDADAVIKCPECALNAYDRKWWPAAPNCAVITEGNISGFNPSTRPGLGGGRLEASGLRGVTQDRSGLRFFYGYVCSPRDILTFPNNG